MSTSCPKFFMRPALSTARIRSRRTGPFFALPSYLHRRIRRLGRLWSGLGGLWRLLPKLERVVLPNPRKPPRLQQRAKFLACLLAPQGGLGHIVSLERFRERAGPVTCGKPHRPALCKE